MTLRNGVMSAVRLDAGRALQPLLGLDRRAAGETLFAASVLAKRNQLGRGFHRRHDAIEVFLTFTVAMHEHRQVARAEGCLAVGDRVDRQRRVRQHFFAIGASDGVMLFEPLQRQTLRGHARRSRSDLVLRFEVNPLCLERAVIDARIDIELGEPLIDVLGPPFAPFLQEIGPIALAVLLAKPVLIDLAQRQLHVRGAASPAHPR